MIVFVAGGMFFLTLGGPLSRSRARPVTATEDDLSLPSFSIFGLSSSAQITNLEKPIKSKELDKFIASVEKSRAARGVAGQPNYYWIVPIVFYRTRGLFARTTWTKEEIKQGLELSAFLARIFSKPDLKIDQADPQFFRKGLQRLRDWFVTLCRDNKTLGLMIYTEDSGPFFGGDVDADKISGMRVLESIAIPDRQARFVLLRELNTWEPIVFGVVNEDGSPRWLKRLSGSPVGRVSSASFIRRTLFELEGYGYTCGLMADWNLGVRQSAIYLDDSLNLRFYFIAT